MIFTLDKRGKAKPENLPCGCKVIRNILVVGVDGGHIQGLTGVNSKTGWMRIQRCAVYPELRRVGPTGRVVLTEMAVQAIQVTAPFELHCKTHGKLEEP